MYLADTEMQDLKRYFRRDLLELDGIPKSPAENCLVKLYIYKVIYLIAPEINLAESEISTSHR